PGRTDPLHPVVIRVGDEQVSGGVDGQPAGRSELSGRGARTANDLLDLPPACRPGLRRRLLGSVRHGPGGSETPRARVLQLRKGEPVAHRRFAGFHAPGAGATAGAGSAASAVGPPSTSSAMPRPSDSAVPPAPVTAAARASEAGSGTAAHSTT